jgi:hypothetical protein
MAPPRLAVTMLLMLVVSMGVLAGCSLVNDPLNEVKQHADGRVEETTVQVPGGRLIFYRIVRDQVCASGVGWDLHGFTGRTGGGGGPCKTRRPLTFTSIKETAGTKPFVLMFGEVNDSRIVRVVITLKNDETPQLATIVNGHWYLYLPDRHEQPAAESIRGFDGEGTEIYRIL